MLALAITAVACGSPTEPQYGKGDMQVLTSSGNYEPGGSVELILHNRGTTFIAYSTCPVFLEIHTIDGWRSSGSQSDGFGLTGCDLIGRWIAPSAQLGFLVRLPQSLSEGKYRLRFENWRSFEDGLVIPPKDHISNSFGVK
jgi:hypothetical protein